MFTSIGRRLALLNAIVVACVIALVGVGTYVLLQQRLDTEANRSLAERARTASETWAEVFVSGIPIPTAPAGSTDEDEDEDEDEDDEDEKDEEEGNELIESGDTLLYAIGSDGTRLASSRAGMPEGLPDGRGIAAALGGREDIRIVRIGADRVRVLSQPVWADGRVIGVVQAAQGQRQHESQLRLVGLSSLAGVGIGILIALPTGLFLARRAMVPIASAFRRQRAFVADASHELRTPLTLIRANTELIRQVPDLSSAEIRAELDAVLDEVDAMSRLIDDLLLLARADSSEIPLARGPVDLAELVREAAHQMAIRADAAGLTIEVRTLDPVVVEADAERIRQVVRNLLDNAITYTPPGGSVTVATIRRGSTGGVLVRDDGIGMTPAEQVLVFDRFYRTDRARSRSTGGTGLGLAICGAIVTAHRGEIGLESQPGQGTTVWFTLPLQPGD